MFVPLHLSGMFQRIKSYLPKSLYGRAALILVLPVVFLQLIVSVVFVQRHFEGVTQQMAESVVSEITLIGDALEAKDLSEAQRLGRLLHIDVERYDEDRFTFQDRRRFYDFSGLVVRRILMSDTAVQGVDLPDDAWVHVNLWVKGDNFLLSFRRTKVSASNPHQLIVNMLVFGALFTIIAFIYLRNQLRPIKRLAKAADAFGRGHSIPYRPTGAIEVRSAGLAFLDMRARIERHIEQRTMILSGVSHDLRTPLTRLKLGLSMLEDEDREPLERDVEDMRRLLDEFLSFARDQNQDNGLAEQIDVNLLLDTIVQDAQRGGISVTFNPCPNSRTVYIRSASVRRALENLINNAVRYGDRAEVSAMLSDRSLIINIEDNGPGIPKLKRAEALKPFVRLDPSRNQNQGTGVGLGLSIAADIARSTGGGLRLLDSQRMGGLLVELKIGI